jgi:hypothetical protein
MMLRIAAAIGIASLVTVIGFQFARILQINSACSRGPLQPSDRVGLARRKTETRKSFFDFPLLEALPRSAYNAHGAMILAPTYLQQPSSYKLRIPYEKDRTCHRRK